MCQRYLPWRPSILINPITKSKTSDRVAYASASRSLAASTWQKKEIWIRTHQTFQVKPCLNLHILHGFYGKVSALCINFPANGVSVQHRRFYETTTALDKLSMYFVSINCWWQDSRIQFPRKAVSRGNSQRTKMKKSKHAQLSRSTMTSPKEKIFIKLLTY
jgi:hypothetical protein